MHVLSAPRRRLLLAATTMLAAALTLPAQAQQSLKAGTSMTPDHPAALLLRKFSEALDTRSGGKLKLQVLTGGVLGADVQMQNQLQAGTQDVMTTGTATMASQMTAHNAASSAAGRGGAFTRDAPSARRTARHPRTGKPWPPASRPP